MATTYNLKPFYLNSNDIAYLLQQVNFVPLFDGAGTDANGIVNFNPASMDAYNSQGVLLWDHAAGQLTQAALDLGFATAGDLGTGFPHVSSPIGIRDVTGLHNNLYGTRADWGAVDVPFRRDVAADFNNYATTGGTAKVAIDPDTGLLTISAADGSTIAVFDVTAYAPGVNFSDGFVRITLDTGDASNAADDKVTFVSANGTTTVVSLVSSGFTGYADAIATHIVMPNYDTVIGANGTIFQSSVIDYMPRIISRTITTAGVNLLRDGATNDSGNFVVWDPARYGTDAVYTELLNSRFNGSPSATLTAVQLSHMVEGAKIVVPPAAPDNLVTFSDGETLIWDAAADQASIYYQTLLDVVAYTNGGALYDSTGGTLDDGEAVHYRTLAGTYVPFVTANGPLIYDAHAAEFHTLVLNSHVDVSTLAAGDAIQITSPTTATGITVVIESGYGLLEQLGHVDFQQPDSGEYFIGSENPGVAPVNMWFAIFGQFFDHGLDLIGKGGQGTAITIALDPNDPLYGATGADGQPVTSITIGRATVAGADANGDPNYVNHTSPFIDQSQTYGSVDQITQLLRKWETTDGGTTYHAGIELFDGQSLADTWTRRWPDGTTTEVRDTLPTLSELRDHVLDTGRTALTWEDVADYRNRDASGQLSGGQSGHALILDMNPRFDTAHLDSTQEIGNTGLTVADLVTDAVATLNASLAGSGMTFQRSASGSIELVVTNGAGGPHLPDGTYTGVTALAPWVNFSNFSIMNPPPGPVGAADVKDAVGQILMAAVGDHYIAGDGRVNENFGLTSIHHVFHEEHNYQVENLKSWIYQHDAANSPGTHDGLHAWQDNLGFGADANGNFLNQDGSIAWNADKMFNATKLLVEMEYQHAAVDQYARTVTPRIQEFVGYSTGVDATVSLEYSQVAFRFGHSTIRETIDTLDPDHWFFGTVTKFALEKAFLNPAAFAEQGVAAITLGLSRAQMNEVDEFITPALNQGLLGQPLDLAAINIARGRDLGIPTLNVMREGLSLAKYTSWKDFGAGMVHPESLANFIAAYSFEGNVAKAQYILDVAAGLAASVPAGMGSLTRSQANAWLNNTYTGTDAALAAAQKGFDHIDAWIGGLAEAHVPGGLLGETFDAVFVAQIQSLMDGDRFYYLYRLFGTNIHEEVNNGQFKDIVERNTGLSHLNGSIFAYADKYYDFTRDGDTATAGDQDNLADHAYAVTLANNPGKGIFSDGGADTTANGTIVGVLATDGIRAGVQLSLVNDTRPELNPAQVHTVEGTPTSGADSHEVIVATDNADFIHARGGDDTVYGEGGDDYIFGDGGVDRLYGGDGNDLIDTGEGPDLADGGAGKDIIYGRGSGSEVGGFDQLVGGSGNDLIIGGEGIDKLSGGSGDDIIYGDGLTNPEMGNTDPFTHGGDGNDYIDGGASGDLIYGEEGDDYLVGGIDQDLLQGGTGDDIIRPGDQSQAINGGPDEVVGDDGYTNTGFDLMDLSDYAAGAPGVTIDLSTQTNPLVAIDGQSPFPAWFQIEGAIGTRNGDTFVGDSNGDATATVSLGNNWLIGGGGNDNFIGSGGDDLIVGGSIRLDALIGHYTDANTTATGALGSMQWLQGAMNTATTGLGGYADGTEDAYTGASNRALGDVSGGLLSGAGFDLHFTEMLRSRMFKDLVLGDGGTDGSADKAVFSGNLAQYSLVALDANGQQVVNPHANWAQVLAVKITDNRTAADFLDANGVPIVDANGNALVNEGTDLIVGVERFQFADGTINVASYFDQAPALDLRYTLGTVTAASDNFNGGGGNAYARGNGWAGDWAETGDQAAGGGGGQNQVYNTGAIHVQGAGGNNTLLQFNRSTAAGGDGAMIARGVDLSGKTGATVGFDLTKTGIGNGETLTLQYSSDGVFFTDIATYGNGTAGTSTASGAQTVSLAGQTFSANSMIRFAVTQLDGTNDYFRIDNVSISATGDTSAGTGNAISYTENAAGTAITSSPKVSDPDDTLMFSAMAVIRDAVAGDRLTVTLANLPAGITATGSGTGVVTLSSAAGASFAAFENALKLITFSSTSDNPTGAQRHIDVTVNDGLKDSNVATTTVSVTAVDDAATALAADAIITNIGTGTNANNAPTITVADWALTANDTDVDGVVISAAANVSGLSNVNHSNGGGGSVSFRDTTPAGGTFAYTSGGLSANVSVSQQSTNGALTGTAAAEILIDNGNAHSISGGGGTDLIFAGGGNDTIVWSVGDGRDFIDGGQNGGGGGGGTPDTFIANGDATAETFDVYSNTDDWDNDATNGIVSSAVHAGLTGLKAATEIVITRNGAVVAELDNVEEIRIVSGAGNDSYAIHGSFTATSLFQQTITIDGGAGNDTVNITDLTSSHRVVFNTGTGNDTFIGPDRPQDQMNLAIVGTSVADYLAGGSDNDTLVGKAGDDLLKGGDGDDTITGDAGNDRVVAGKGNDSYDGGTGSDSYVAKYTTHDVIVDLQAQTADGADVGHDTVVHIENVYTGSGDDDITGNSSANILFGGDGSDEISGLAGGDKLSGGKGDDVLSGGNDGDTFIFESGFGNDIITDFDADAAGGQDLIDLSRLGITASEFAAHVSVEDTGADIVLHVDNHGTITLKNIANASQITVDDFVLFAVG